MEGREVTGLNLGWGFSAMGPESLNVRADFDLNRLQGRAKKSLKLAQACCPGVRGE